MKMSPLLQESVVNNLQPSTVVVVPQKANRIESDQKEFRNKLQGLSVRYSRII